jgi:hypothetical protein
LFFIHGFRGGNLCEPGKLLISFEGLWRPPIAGAKRKTYAATATLVRKQNPASLSPLDQFGAAGCEELGSSEDLKTA